MHLRSIRIQIIVHEQRGGDECSTSKNGIADSYVTHPQSLKKFNTRSDDSHALSTMILRNVAIRHSKSLS